MKIYQQELLRLSGILFIQSIDKIPLVELRNIIALCKKYNCTSAKNPEKQISAIAQLTQQEIQRRLITNSCDPQDAQKN